jgi:glycine/D-amino acid oxidase-like deaminating enzyme
MQFSIWEKDTFLAPQDIIIVGAGFAGLWSAFFLINKNPKLKITVVDRGTIPTGASTRNAGFACFGSVSELVYDARTMGNEKMLQLVEMRYRGLQRIQKYFPDKRIDFDLCGGYELFNQKQKSTEELNENIEYINTLLRIVTGSKKTFRLLEKKIDKFEFGNITHIVKNNCEGYLHSGKLLYALWQDVQAKGVRILTGIRIKQFQHNGKQIEVKTADNITFSAKQLLVCTNAFANELIPEAGITPARGQVLLTSPIKNLPWKGAFHFDEGFYYFRNLGNRVLLGGARNKAFTDEGTTDLQTSDFIQLELETFLDEFILPKQRKTYTIDHRWSGIMGMGADKIPSLKEVKKNIYCAIGLGGMGVALAPVLGCDAAKLLTH